MEGLFWLVAVAGVAFCFIFCRVLGGEPCLWFGSSSNHFQLALSACLSFFWLVVYVFSGILLLFCKSCLWTCWFSSLVYFFDMLYILTFWYKKKKASSDSAYNRATHVVQFATVRWQWDFSLLPSKFRVVLLFIFSFNCGPPLLIGLYLFCIFCIFFLSILSLFHLILFNFLY
jgi:hypothetical protein